MNANAPQPASLPRSPARPRKLDLQAIFSWLLADGIVEKDKVKAVNQIFTLVKKAVGDKEISVGITGSANLSADEIKNCKTALEKLGFTDIRFE